MKSTGAAVVAGPRAGLFARAQIDVAALRPLDRRADILGDHQPLERRAVQSFSPAPASTNTGVPSA